MHNHTDLLPVRLADLRATQLTVGFAEVARKRAQWAQMPKAKRKGFLSSHWFPAVRGPNDHLYIVDHHHLGRALMEEGIATAQAVLLRNLSHLQMDEFWTVMDLHHWVHPFDAKGKRQPVSRLPKSVEGLVDDPYRSLAWAVREAGGFAKDTAPFAEFLWADFFRRRIPAKIVKDDLPAATRRAAVLAHGADAHHLPGWCAAA